MKKFLMISWGVFILGLTFKLLHYPGYAFLLILGSLLIFTHSIIYLIKNAKQKLPNSFVFLAFSFWTFYLIWRFQYWGSAPMIFFIASLITFTCLILHLVMHVNYKFPQIILTIYFIFSVIISFIHTDSIFYFFKLNQTLNSEYREIDYQSWDKYSWFLYLAGKTDAATKANQKAQKALDDKLEKKPDDEAPEYIKLIKQHKQQIQDKNWIVYP